MLYASTSIIIYLNRVEGFTHVRSADLFTSVIVRLCVYTIDHKRHLVHKNGKGAHRARVTLYTLSEYPRATGTPFVRGHNVPPLRL